MPRASLIVPAGELGSGANIWMGGAHSLRGEEIRHESLSAAWLIDTAGDMSPLHRAAASETIACVFVDTEGAPSPFWRIEETVTRAEQAARGDVAFPPEHIYIVCTHGMNRSGLITGLLLGRLGLTADAAIDRIRLHRPGALSNHTFQQILRELHP
jgi:hypothetical protein